MHVQYSFERYEKKYRIQNYQLDALLDRLEPFLEGDAYGLHTICSVYYDTPDYKSIRDKEHRRVYKEKLRVRSYGTPRPEDTVYVELKKKVDGVTYKRRAGLPYRQAADYLNRGAKPPADSQILGEIDWFIARNAPEPKSMICYDRLAYAGRNDPSFRVTFDQNIRWRDYKLDLSAGSWGAPLTDPGEILMEIKTASALPLWMSAALSDLSIFPQSFSKYGATYLHSMHEEVTHYAG